MADGLEKGHGDGNGDGHSGNALAPRRVSLVSIDMGLRNLAYAHLTAEVLSDTNNDETSLDTAATTASKYEDTRSDSRPRGAVLSQIQLREWRRLDIAALSSSLSSSAPSPSTEIRSATPPALPRKSMPPFDPAHLATQAHALIAAFIRRHKPSHILIERQRFRSGGGPAVQEWSIRVGVFEWVLWAVLRTLGARIEGLQAVDGGGGGSGVETERGGGGMAEGTSVHAAQPTRVNRYWMDRGRGSKPDNGGAADVADIEDILAAGLAPEQRTRRTSPDGENEIQDETAEIETRAPTGRDLKRAKIDIVGDMLRKVTTALPSHNAESPSPLILSSASIALPFTLQPSSIPTAASFLSTWNTRNGINANVQNGKPNRRSQKPKDEPSAIKAKDAKIDKLDDLADCLLQGLAWIRWQNNIVDLRAGLVGRLLAEGRELEKNIAVEEDPTADGNGKAGTARARRRDVTK